ncbi:MAG: GNAT family N-acetyltransferase [Lachnospiraceae bacterium]|nr:GNAT family N-acetyltransferase [Lachnospiraceae bacterium]
MIIEKATITDLDELEHLYNNLNDYLSTHTNYPGWAKNVYPTRETAAAGIKEDALYVARESGRIAGTFILRHTPEEGYQKADWHIDLDYCDILVLYTFAVHPDYFGRGIGTKLLTFIQSHAASHHIKAIRLDVYEKNTPAISLYQKCGFQYIATVDLGYSSYGLEHFKLYQKLL